MIVKTGLDALSPALRQELSALPRSLTILLDSRLTQADDAEAATTPFRDWLAGTSGETVPFRPTRILMQDTAGVAALVDLAALRDAVAEAGGEAQAVDPVVPIDLVIDHSLQVDFSGVPNAVEKNAELEFGRNEERYAFFRWCQQAFPALRIVPPGQGICHQINLEQLSAIARPVPGQPGVTGPEVVIGTDSHTTMINALGIMGWGVGGIEAELAAFGEPVPLALPRVTLVELTGKPAPGVSATDIALSLTAFLRPQGVVGEILEFAGEGVAALSLPDRAAIANMSPEYGATAGLFAVDEETLRYLWSMGRSAENLALYEGYARATGLWADQADRQYSRALTFDLSRVVPVMSGPARPQDTVPLADVPDSLPARANDGEGPTTGSGLRDGAVLIAAITSCTNTANPVLMLQAGLVARRAMERGIAPPEWVKRSLAPGSRKIAALLEQAGLMPALEAIGFHVVGYGCATCVGNSGALKEVAQNALALDPDLVSVAVLSGNRNFPNRIHADVKANYLASPPLVVAAALAGSLAGDLVGQPIAHDPDGQPVYLRDIWPEPGEAETLLARIEGEVADSAPANKRWDALKVTQGTRFAWEENSLRIQRPPFYGRVAENCLRDITDARVLLHLGDSITTDHVSPIGEIKPGSPAFDYLSQAGWVAGRRATYGEFRGNHEIMLRGGFDNARLLNLAVGESGNRALGPDGEVTSVFDAAMAHARAGTELVIVAGDNYGSGSARDWAAKATALLGVRAVIAKSFERIHRSNLVAMGVIPIRADGLPPEALSQPLKICALADAGPGSEVQISWGDGQGSLTGVVELATQWEADLLRRGGFFSHILKTQLDNGR